MIRIDALVCVCVCVLLHPCPLKCSLGRGAMEWRNTQPALFASTADELTFCLPFALIDHVLVEYVPPSHEVDNRPPSYAGVLEDVIEVWMAKEMRLRRCNG